MNIFIETLLISVCMLTLCMLPVFSENIRRYSKLFYFLGTGALAGILFFDLIPDLFEMGGSTSLWGVAAVWLVYSLLHLFHLKHHKNEAANTCEHHGHTHGQSGSFFLISMISHCIASGMLLVVSQGFSGSLNKTIFWALFAHKAYESLTVSSVLIAQPGSKRKFFTSILAYSLSMPFGVLLTHLFRASLTPNIALLITSLAAGTLMGCLIFDFLLPSLSRVHNRRHALTWIVIGLGFTQLLMKSL